jgi:hypothetical protein
MKKMKNIGRSGKHEARSQAQTRPAVPIPIAIGTIGSNRGLYFVCPAVGANTEGENNEYRITNIESGSRKSEVGRQKSEDGRRKSEVRRQKTVPYFPSKGRTGLFLISRRKAGQAYFLFPGKENKEYRISNKEYRITNNESGSRKPEVGSQEAEDGSLFSVERPDRLIPYFPSESRAGLFLILLFWK